MNEITAPFNVSRADPLQNVFGLVGRQRAFEIGMRGMSRLSAGNKRENRHPIFIIGHRNPLLETTIE
ncbi:hypothetical protein [Hyphomicrobium sp.]|uniref:hypothetical protein n=1 Tax=Hyphomicrobium sp. TaxID=82 RepID=UPI002D77DCD5|nr:hypothetical protein [Hyphomicrobium sp.]HET6387811.1 hypothetical protein [Hyphomicrobium sp.]